MPARTSKTLVFIIVVVVLLVYIRDYMRSGPRFSMEQYIIQTRVDKFKSDILLERQPVVIHDRVFDVLGLAKNTLRYQYVYVKMTENQQLMSFKRPMDTLAKFTFITPLSIKEGGKVSMAARPVGTSEDKDIVFRLRSGQVLILPAHWQLRCVGSSEASELGISVDSDQEEKGEVEHGDCINIKKVEVFDLVHLLMWGPMRAIFPFGRTSVSINKMT